MSSSTGPTWPKCLKASRRPLPPVGKGVQQPRRFRRPTTTTTTTAEGPPAPSTPTPGRREKDCSYGNKLSFSPRQDIPMEQIRTRPNFYTGSSLKKQGHFKEGCGEKNIEPPSHFLDHSQKHKATMEDERGLLSKKTNAIGNMYSRFIEDSQSFTHRHPKQPKNMDFNQENPDVQGEEYVPMSMDTGSNKEIPPTPCKGSVVMTLRGTSKPMVVPGPSVLDVITEDQREGPHTGDNDDPGGDMRKAAQLSPDDGGYLQPLPPSHHHFHNHAHPQHAHPQHAHLQHAHLQHAPSPQPSPADLRLLELIRRARLGSGRDSGIFFGDDFSMSDVSDGGSGYRGAGDPGYRAGDPGPSPNPGRYCSTLRRGKFNVSVRPTTVESKRKC